MEVWGRRRDITVRQWNSFLSVMWRRHGLVDTVLRFPGQCPSRCLHTFVLRMSFHQGVKSEVAPDQRRSRPSSSLAPFVAPRRIGSVGSLAL